MKNPFKTIKQLLQIQTEIDEIWYFLKIHNQKFDKQMYLWKTQDEANYFQAEINEGVSEDITTLYSRITNLTNELKRR